MPMVFAAHAGSMLALTGTPVNVLVSDAAMDARVGEFGFFEFALVGIPLLAGTMAIIVLFGKRLLPERNGATMPADFSRHAKTLVEQYGLTSGRLPDAGPGRFILVGKAIAEVSLSTIPSWSSWRIHEGMAGPLRRSACDRGRPPDRPRRSRRRRGLCRRRRKLRFASSSPGGEDMLFNSQSGLAEVVIPPRSGLIGTERVPGHGHRKRRSDHPRRPARGAQKDVAGNPPTGAASSCRPATRCSCKGPGRRWTSISMTRTCWSSIRPNWCAARRCRWDRGQRQAIVILVAMVFLLPPACPARRSRAARRRCRRLDGHHERRTGYRAIGWTTVILVGAMMPLVDGNGRDGCGPAAWPSALWTCGRCGPVRPPRRPVRGHRDHGTADQQHRDRADRDPDRRRGGARAWAFRPVRC